MKPSRFRLWTAPQMSDFLWHFAMCRRLKTHVRGMRRDRERRRASPMEHSHSARLVSLDRAGLIAWVTWAVYTLGCAWPMWPAPWWVYPLACLGYGLLARVTGSAICAGAAGACASAPMLRVACDAHGELVGVLTFALAWTIVATIMHRDPPIDADGRMPAGGACTLLWLASTAAGPLGLFIADVLAWLASR